jgi:hypothetical protein
LRAAREERVKEEEGRRGGSPNHFLYNPTSYYSKKIYKIGIHPKIDAS